METTEVIKLLSLPIGAVAVLIGTLAIIKPKLMSKGFGIEVNESHTSYVIALGIRDVFIGLSVLTLYFFAEWRVLSFVSLFIAMVAVSDFLVVFKNGAKRSSYTHLLGAVFSTVYSALLYINL